MPNDYSAILSQEEFESSLDLVRDFDNQYEVRKVAREALVNSHTALLSLCWELKGLLERGIERTLELQGDFFSRHPELNSLGDWCGETAWMNEARKLLAAYPLTKGADE